MDYSRIYGLFIENRKSKQAFLVESGSYCEKHHIVPRCYGGANNLENIVCLTPEDHYFAHLLLAKIHGGLMWHAARAMCNLPVGARNLDAFKGRSMFGYVRRRCAEEYSRTMSGENSPIADKRRHTFCNIDGRRVRGTRLQIMSDCGLSNRAVSALITGSKRSFHGWYCKETNRDGLIGGAASSEALSSKVVHKLFHHDGREWSGTFRQFRSKFGRQLFFQSEEGHCAGWYRTKEQANNHEATMREKCTIVASARGDISGANNPRADKTVYSFENERTGEVVRKTRTDMARDYGLRTAALTGIVRGYQIAAGDWKLRGTMRQRKKAIRA